MSGQFRGYIYPEVWTAWYTGMKIFRGNPRIAFLWDEELKTESYYGLSFDDENDTKRDKKQERHERPDTEDNSRFRVDQRNAA